MKRVIKAGLDTKSLTIEQFESLLKSYKLNPVVNRQAVYGEYTDTEGHTIRIRFYVSNTTSKVTLDSLLLKGSIILYPEDLAKLSQIVKSLQSDLQDTKVLGLYSTEDSEKFTKSRRGTRVKVEDTIFDVFYQNRTWIAVVVEFPCNNPAGLHGSDLILDYNRNILPHLYKGITDPVNPDIRTTLNLPAEPTVSEVKAAILNSSELWKGIEQVKTWVEKNSNIYINNTKEFYKKEGYENAPEFHALKVFYCY